MELTNKNIEEYINRFLDGETTNAEEQAIYRFFCTGNVPAHLKEYAPMFAWYEGGMQGEPKPQAMEDTSRKEKNLQSSYSRNGMECRDCSDGSSYIGAGLTGFLRTKSSKKS